MRALADGRAAAAARIAKASGVVIEFDRDAIEAEASHLAPAARVCAVDPVRWVLQGGEEHGMIAVFPPDAQLPDGFRVVGSVRACLAEEEPRAMMDGAVLRGAWDHFSADSVD